MQRSSPLNPTRGQGKLENFIADRRIERVLKYLKSDLYTGEVLDIGCGSYPKFLLRAPFQKKVGLDQLGPTWLNQQSSPPANLEILKFSLGGKSPLPFQDNRFECVTSLACLEHLEPAGLPFLATEIFRVLKPGGQVLITTPHAVADKVLRLMAKLNLVSSEEIEEHKSLFYHRDIFNFFLHAGFASKKIKVHGFQLGLNILAVAEK